jgi:peptidoglycan/xylan/chitin deacetylase (PgdA/CDA1 family)
MKLLRRLTAALKPRRRAPALILMYHRIAADSLDPWQLCVTPQNFADQLDWLREHCRLVPLHQLAAELAAGGVANRSVAISFDDGYADNLLAGEPLLRERGLAATFFLTTATLGGPREFWWDELERLLMRPQALPATLRFSLDGQEKRFDPGSAAAACDPVREFRGVRPWKAAPGSRLAFYYEVWGSLRFLEEQVRQGALAHLREQLDAPPALNTERRTLTHGEVLQLARSPAAEIGAHSVTHAAFSRRSPAQQSWEMQHSKQELESLIGQRVMGFAYPYGDYGPESARLAREAGFEFACTTDETPISTSTSVHLLPRFAVEDCNARDFGARVAKVLA